MCFGSRTLDSHHFAGASRATKQAAAVRTGGANHREGDVHEFCVYTVAAVSVLARELVGALRGVEVGAEDKQALREMLVRLKLKEACAIVAAAPGPFAVLLVALVGYHVVHARLPR